jgi:GTP diphosphokinase / guanosine-3',5'-bis(diphosphate) 3'-diphosphatase
MEDQAATIVRFGDIEEKVKSYHEDADLNLIRMAYVYSARVHKGQSRIGGEPYLVHPVAVAKLLAQMKLDEGSIVAGLLHDTVEDTLTSVEDLEKFFGKDVAMLVDGVTKISKMAFQSKQQRQAESFRKMILAMSRDVRVLLIKLADRLHNMRTLAPLKPEARKRISKETLDIYAPLAGRLGIYWIRTELENLAFMHLEPEIYADLEARKAEALKRQEEYVNSVLSVIKENLRNYKIQAETKWRTKEIYSIHQKMVSQQLEFDQVHDLTAFRIIVNTVEQCYGVLGLIHNLWSPVPGRFKDYIALPKQNGYKSLHTTVIGPEGRRIELQIRTHGMDLVAEQGIAAHWSYKEGKSLDDEDTKVISWLRQITEWQQDLDDPKDFLENVRIDLYPDEVYVFTPNGDVKDFPKGATPLDFAYSIHSEVGNTCSGARVNGKMVPLKYQLQTGETVEIMRSTRQKPNKDWLKYAKTAKARAKIRQYIRAEERTQALEMGRDSVERELKRWRMELAQTEKDGAIKSVAEELSFKTEDDLYVAIGFGRVSPKVVITKVVPVEERDKAKEALKHEKHYKISPSAGKSGVNIDGLTGVMVNFAKCCNPVPGDTIKGFITRGRGVTIHNANCPNLLNSDTRRLVDASWDVEQALPRMVRLGVDAQDRTGLLEMLAGVFSSNDSNIIQAQVTTSNEHIAHCLFTVSVRDVNHLGHIINALKSVKGVESVQRLGL